MTGQATVTANNAGIGNVLLVECVKHHTLLGIVSRKLEKRRAPNESHDDIVIEIERSWVRGTDIRRLNAGPGKNNGLRFDRDAQGIEYGSQITASRIELERQLALL